MVLDLTGLTKPTGTSTNKAKLSIAELTDGSAGTYTEIPGFQSIPDMNGTSEKIDTTTLADTVKTSIPGVKDLGELEFKFLYCKENFVKLKTVLDENTPYAWKVEYSDGLVAKFNATPTLGLGGGDINTALSFTIAMSLQTDITFE